MRHPNRTVAGKGVEPVGDIFAGPRSKGRAHHFLGSSSEWQAVNLKRAIAITVFVLSALAFFFLVFNGLFVIYAETCHPELTWEQVAEVEVDGKPASPSEGEEAPQSMRPQIELALSLFSAVVMLISARLVWRYYRKGYEIKEEPVVFPQKGSEIRWRKIFGSQTDLNKNVQAYADEFLVNAFVEPRMVFSRISESVSPGRRMLDSVVSYEVLPPAERGLSFFDADDLMLKKDKENRKFRSCSLVVPVSFQKRGKLVMKQEVRNASGTVLPVLKQSEFVARILELIDRFLTCGKDYSKIEDRWNESRGSLESYLSSMECNKTVDCAIEAAELMVKSRGGTERVSVDDQEFIRGLTRILVGLKDVIPVCVSLRVAAVKGAKSSFPPQVFSLRLEEKREMDVKPHNAFPNRKESRLRERANKAARILSRRSDTIYYNLARAARSTSYHLYVEGPEGTYYSRGSLLRENTGDRRPIIAEHVEMQKRRGQRNAHIYIRTGHRMSNVVFMFRYKKAPLDTFHIMFIATLLCATVLVLCAMTSIREIGESTTSLSMATMLLAVVSAAGPWIYNRASDGREESFGIEAATIVTTASAVLGMVLFSYLGNVKGGLVWAPTAWGLLVAVMGLTAAMVGLVALMHTSLYRYLLDKPAVESGLSDDRPWHDEDILTEEREGVRFDTPQGRLVENPYRLWTVACTEFEKGCEAVAQGEGR